MKALSLVLSNIFLQIESGVEDLIVKMLPKEDRIGGRTDLNQTFWKALHKKMMHQQSRRQCLEISMCSLRKFTNGAFSHVSTPRPMGRTSLSTSQIRAMILEGLELCQSCCTTMRRPSSSTHCWVKLFNRVFLLLGLSICHVTKERRKSKTMPCIPFLVTWVYWRFSTNLFA